MLAMKDSTVATSSKCALHGNYLARRRDQSLLDLGNSGMFASPKKFSLESDMTFPARNWLEFAGFTTKDEFRTPWGVCDLVGVKLSKRYIESRLTLGQSRPVGNAKRVALLECIPSGRDISARELARRTSHLLSVEELPSELKQLQADHFVKRTERDWYSRLIPASTESNLILAVEIKLGKVEEALLSLAKTPSAGAKSGS